MTHTHVDPAFLKMLEGYSLTTAEILYWMPDRKLILQTYVWQDYDMAPKFPALIKFLDFWDRKLDGPIKSVRVAHARLNAPVEIRNVSAPFQLN